MNKQQEPRLRFQGFTGAWEEKKVIDFSPLQRGFDLPVSKIIEGDYPVVFSNGILKSHNQYKVKGVGIVTGRSGTIGEVTFVEKDFWPHNTALWVTNFFGNNPQFVFHFLKNFDLSRFATGSGVPTLNRNDVHNQTIYVPKFEEQTAIGNFFRRLDSQIAESRAVLEKSRQLKKAMLAKMFPANGEKIPKIRFKGFEGEWEYRKLGEIGSTFGGLTNKSREDFGHGDARYITYMNVYQNALSSEHQLDSIEIDVKQNEVKKGDVLFTTSSETPEEVGMSSVWAFDINNVYLNSFCFGYRLNKQIDLNYLAYCLRSDYIRSQMILLAQGISRYNISKKGVMEIEILIPTSEEQTVIGNFFRQLDETIALQSAEVEKLNQLKKGLLAAMLV